MNGNWQHTWSNPSYQNRKKNNHYVPLQSDHRESLHLLEDIPNPVFGSLECKLMLLRMQSSPGCSGVEWAPLWSMNYQHQCMHSSSFIGFFYGKVQWKRLFPSNYLHVSSMISEGLSRLQLNLSLLALNSKTIMTKWILTRISQEKDKRRKLFLHS